MRLIVEYQDSNGYTFSNTVSKPVIYKSAEDFIVDFEAKCKSSNVYEFTIGGARFMVSNFIILDEFYPPDVYTLDEWYEQNVQS
jgi:hypothetical protein